ncbi:monooxygenase [Hypoxylon texense]
MAPRTRRTTALVQDSPVQESANKADIKPTVPKRRGRPSKSTTAASSSTSSAPTPSTTISDSEYSTPATSNAVTPAPSVVVQRPVAGALVLPNGRRNILDIELPDISQDSSPKPKGFRSTRRRSAPVSYKEESEEDEDEDEYFPGDTSRSAAMARRLQREEHQKAASSSTRPSARGKRPLPDIDSSDDDDEEYGWLQNPGHRSAKKLKFTEPAIGEGEEEDVDALGASDSDDNSDGYPNFISSSYGSESESEASTSTDQDASTSVAASVVPRSAPRHSRKAKKRMKFEDHHPDLVTMWTDLEKMPVLKAGKAEQPDTISRQLKPFQLEGLAWMMGMEKTQWKGGLLGDEMGLGKTIQAVSLIMSDHPAKAPSLVLVPPVALMQWTNEIESYTNGKLKTFIYHGTNTKAKKMTVRDLKKFDVIMMSYNTLESLYRKQEKGFKREDGTYKVNSPVHQINFHRVILDEAHSIKSRTTMTAKACFALKADHRWALSGTPVQNRIGEFFSLLRFLRFMPYASYFCKGCSCSHLEWEPDDKGNCKHCKHYIMQHVSVFNIEILNPLTTHGNRGEGKKAWKKLRLLTDRIMLRRLKKDHMNAMELPVKEIVVDRQFFSEIEADFASSIMTNNERKFNTYVEQGVMLNNYANIFGLIMQMRQLADHPDLILKKNSEGGQNVLVCCICDEPAEEAVRSRCKHDFCRSCAKSYVNSQEEPDCPCCHIPLSIDLEQPEMEQDEVLVKKSSIINRIKMENWTSSSKIELLVHELHRLRSDNASHKSIIFSQFTTMLQLIEWRLRRAGITTVMLDGSMTPAQRQASISHFMNNVDVECFLVSLKAGGVALNLTEASRVFIVDP